MHQSLLYFLLRQGKPYQLQVQNITSLYSQLLALPLQYLLAHDMYDIAELIIRNSDRDFNLRPNESCMTILHYCAWKGMTHLVSLLLSKGADVSASYGTNMRTPYVTALQHGHTATVEALSLIHI